VVVLLTALNATRSAAELCTPASNASGISSAALTFAIGGSGVSVAAGANVSACFAVSSSLPAGTDLAQKIAGIGGTASLRGGTAVAFVLPLMALPFSSGNFTVFVAPLAASCFTSAAGYVTLSTALSLGIVDFSAAACAVPPATAAVKTAQVAGRVGQIAVIASVNPAMAAQAMRAGLSLALIVCDVQPEPLSAMQSPLGLSVGSSKGRYYAGAAVGNTLLLLGFALAQVGAAAVLRATARRPTPPAWREVFATVRFPSLCVFPLMFFQQVTVAAGVTTVMSAETALAPVGVAVVLCMAAVLPLAYVFVLQKAVFGCTYVAHRRELGLLSLFFFGKGRWCDASAAAADDGPAPAPGAERSFFKQRFQFFFADNLPQGRCFMLGEMAMNILCGVCQGLISPAYCKSLLFASVVVFGGFACAGLYVRPFASLCYGIFSVGQAVLQLISCALSILAVVTNSEKMLDLAAYSNTVCMYALILQAVVGLWPKMSQIRRWIARLQGRRDGDGAPIEVTSANLAALDAAVDVPLLPFAGGCELPPAVSPVPTEAAVTTVVSPSPASQDMLAEAERRSKTGTVDENAAAVAAPLPEIPSQDSLDDLFAELHAVNAPAHWKQETSMADLEYSPLVSMRLPGSSLCGEAQRDRRPAPDADEEAELHAADALPSDEEFEL
jgi:hypothetical protein